MIGREKHPAWCDVARCRVQRVGEHRSVPMTARVPKVGNVVVSLVQRAHGAAYVEAVVSAALPPDPDDQRAYAETVLQDLCDTVAAISTRWQARLVALVAAARGARTGRAKW